MKLQKRFTVRGRVVEVSVWLKRVVSVSVWIETVALSVKFLGMKRMWEDSSEACKNTIRISINSLWARGAMVEKERLKVENEQK